MTAKEKILQVALELGSERGLGNLSLSAIADRVGIRKATIYSHFESKAELIHALYEHIRKKSLYAMQEGPTDYEKLVEGKSAEETLNLAVSQYDKLTTNKEMTAFYKLIYSERVFNKSAAKIIAMETTKMELTIRQLFYVLQAHQLLKFEDIVSAATIFSMTVHGLLDRQKDFTFAGFEDDTADRMKSFIHEFCEIYKWET